jgi:hypothetical protein
VDEGHSRGVSQESVTLKSYDGRRCASTDRADDALDACLSRHDRR